MKAKRILLMLAVFVAVSAASASAVMACSAEVCAEAHAEEFNRCMNQDEDAGYYVCGERARTMRDACLRSKICPAPQFAMLFTGNTGDTLFTPILTSARYDFSVFHTTGYSLFSFDNRAEQARADCLMSKIFVPASPPWAKRT